MKHAIGGLSRIICFSTVKNKKDDFWNNSLGVNLERITKRKT
jgi:hypothetical protein